MKRTLFLMIFTFVSIQAIFSQSYEEKYIKGDDVEFYTRSYGEGNPLIVIHGGPGLSMDYLLPALAKLSEKRKVIFYDQRGCGKSIGKIDEKNINVETFLNDIDSIKKAYNIKKMDLLGHSWGGFLAMKYAIKNPKSINSLILLTTMPATSEGVSEFLAEVSKRMKPEEKVIQKLKDSKEFKEGSATISEKYYGLFFRSYLYDPEKVKLLNLKMNKEEFLNGIKVNSFLVQTFFSPYNLLEDLSKLNIPALIMHGDSDVIPLESSKAIADHIKYSSLVIFEKCGHFPYVEKPSKFFESLFQFFDQK